MCSGRAGVNQGFNAPPVNARHVLLELVETELRFSNDAIMGEWLGDE